MWAVAYSPKVRHPGSFLNRTDYVTVGVLSIKVDSILDVTGITRQFVVRYKLTLQWGLEGEFWECLISVHGQTHTLLVKLQIRTSWHKLHTGWKYRLRKKDGKVIHDRSSGFVSEFGLRVLYGCVVYKTRNLVLKYSKILLYRGHSAAPSSTFPREVQYGTEVDQVRSLLCKRGGQP